MWEPSLQSFHRQRSQRLAQRPPDPETSARFPYSSDPAPTWRTPAGAGDLDLSQSRWYFLPKQFSHSFLAADPNLQETGLFLSGSHEIILRQPEPLPDLSADQHRERCRAFPDYFARSILAINRRCARGPNPG